MRGGRGLLSPYRKFSDKTLFGFDVADSSQTGCRVPINFPASAAERT